MPHETMDPMTTWCSRVRACRCAARRTMILRIAVVLLVGCGSSGARPDAMPPDAHSVPCGTGTCPAPAECVVVKDPQYSCFMQERCFAHCDPTAALQCPGTTACAGVDPDAGHAATFCIACLHNP